MTQTSLWQAQSLSTDYVELCNALYERELTVLANIEMSSTAQLQARIKSLPHYIKCTAHYMTQVNAAKMGNPLMLDTQNASWVAKQPATMPLVGQNNEKIKQWYASFQLPLGLVVPIALSNSIVLDSVDRIDSDKNRIRTNVHGWFSLIDLTSSAENKLLKINKKVMLSACAGHCWQSQQNTYKRTLNKKQPIALSLRELLLSCQINWQNFKAPLLL